MTYLIIVYFPFWKEVFQNVSCQLKSKLPMKEIAKFQSRECSSVLLFYLSSEDSIEIRGKILLLI